MSALSVKHLGSIRNPKKTIHAEQLFFNDVLIFIITLSTAEDYVTNNPEKDWEQQLDIEFTARDLNNLLGIASILSTTCERSQDILMNVRTKITFAKKQSIHYCTLDFGHFWRFGNNDNYLLVVNQQTDQTDRINRFIVNNFPYILSLILILKKDYKIFLELRKQLLEIETQTQQHSHELENLKKETDSIMLAIRKDHIEELVKNASKIKLVMRNNAEQMNRNTIKLSTAIKNLGIIKDQLFNEEIKLFNSYNEFIRNELQTTDKIFNRISTEVERYSNQVTKLIEELDIGFEEPKAESKIYGPKTSNSESFSFNDSPYKSYSERFTSGIESKTKLLDSIPLQWCSSYILFEQKPKRTLKIFTDLVTNRFLGLCITHEEREAIIKKFDLKDIEVYQIASKDGDYFTPPILSKISHLINEFLSNNIHSIIHLDGIEFLINANDFNRVLKFNNNIKESIVLSDSILLISLNESSIDKNELALLVENSVDITNFDVEFEDLL